MLKLKLQYFGHLMRRVDSLAKTLMLGKVEGKRRRACQRMRWLDSKAQSKAVAVALNQKVVDKFFKGLRRGGGSSPGLSAAASCIGEKAAFRMGENNSK